jgi:hypothetical protein
MKFKSVTLYFLILAATIWLITGCNEDSNPLIADSGCVKCHTDQDQLKNTMEPPEDNGSEGAGEG